MNKIFKICFISFLSSLLFAACSSDKEIVDVTQQSENLISFNLKYSVEDMSAGTAESKALTRSDSDGDGISSDIKNILVVQFNGSESSSTVSRVDYITDLVDPEVHLIETKVSTIVLLIANTFDADCISKGQTLAEVKSAGVTMSGNITQTTNGVIYDESLVTTDGESKYFIFSDCKIYEWGIRQSEDIEINFQRNVAKITLNVTNGWEDQTLTSIKLGSIPSTYLYYANRQNEEEDPKVPTTVSSTTSYSNDIGIVGSQNSPVVTTLSFYMPVNMRGVDSASTETTKPNSSCATGATYAKIAYDYKENTDSDTSQKVNYTLYLGSNLSTDFNLRPNTHYAYNISIYGMGDNVETDERINIVEIFDGSDYTQKKSSNCYILNPSKDVLPYHIPVAERINDYWTNYANDSSKCISTTDIDNWDFEILWYDNGIYPYVDSEDDLSNDTLTIEKELTSGETPALKITLGEEFDNWGNILLAVKDPYGDILWSWHLWITDYNPYNHGLTDRTAGSYTLENETGALHRYGGSTSASMSVWNSGGIYADKYIMDRNIGARSAELTDSKGLLYYQFGRKDPLPYSATTLNSNYALKAATTSSVSMSTAIANPTTKYGSSTWCTDEDCAGTGCLWNDKNLTDKDAGGKSIFDPSPYGFRVPIYKVWGDSALTSFTQGTNTNGLYFNMSNVSFFHPSCGYMAADATSYTITELYNYTIYVASTPYSDTHGYSICKTSIDKNQSGLMRASAASVRCIEDVDE